MHIQQINTYEPPILEHLRLTAGTLKNGCRWIGIMFSFPEKILSTKQAIPEKFLFAENAIMLVLRLSNYFQCNYFNKTLLLKILLETLDLSSSQQLPTEEESSWS